MSLYLCACVYLNEFGPFQENSFYRNWVLGAGDLDGQNYIDTGVGFPDYRSRVPVFDEKYVSPVFQYVSTGDGNLLTPVLSDAQARFIYHENVTLSQGDARVGVSIDGSNLQMASSFQNLFGLPYVSLKSFQVGGAFDGLSILPGGTYPDNGSYNDVSLFQEVAAPVLVNDGFYFSVDDSWSGMGESIFPGDPEFTVNATTPLLIASVGQLFPVAGWEKMSIANGDPNKFAYLGLYFDKAFKADPNGQPTTEETGVLSEYGEFFPTEPGRAILTTKPDLSGNVGQATVYVMKLELDVNHDGTIDRTLGGPDNTSPERPFRFWVNNDHDGVGAGEEVRAPGLPDYSFGRMRSERNLEDFARLWVSGLPALSAGEGYTITLSMTPSSGSPSINLYAAYDQNGGPEYQTSTTAAAAQFTQNFLNGQLVFDFAQRLGEIGPNQSFTLPVFPDGELLYSRFLFEGSGIGSGQLYLTVKKDGQSIAETSVFIELLDVQDMYERAYSVDGPTPDSLPPSSAVSRMVIQSVLPPDPSEERQMIVFVHGINNTDFDVKTSSESMFKRLYWSGYHGRFASFRWPCHYLPFENTINPFNYNKGEFYAWKSAQAFKDYLAYLSDNSRLPGYTINVIAHSQGNVVASEAMAQGAPFDNYILTQGAIPAHCYDGDAPPLDRFLEPPLSATPYDAANGGYHESFSALTGNVVNFFNAQDYALATGTWGPLEANWEKNQESQKPESFYFGTRYYTYDANTQTSYLNLRVPTDDFGGFEIQSSEVTDPHEIRSMIARSRTKAVGAMDGLGGVIGSGVDLEALFGFGDTRPEHSAQFTRNIQTVLDYYSAVRVNITTQ